MAVKQPGRSKNAKLHDSLSKQAQKVYHQRNLVLVRMGFASYEDYRASDLWQSIRRKVLASNGHCYGCGYQATEVHHSRYELLDMAGKRLDNLISVCRWCHQEAEFGASGRKLSPLEAKAKLSNIRAHLKGATHEKVVAYKEKHEARPKVVPAPAEKWIKVSPSVLRIAERARQYIGMDPSDEAREISALFDAVWPITTKRYT